MPQANILIVDDDRRLRTLLERYLNEQDLAVSGVDDGLQLAQKLERDTIDLIVLDWMLPGEDGLSICRRLSADKTNPPIIILTANGSVDERILGLKGGAEDYLPKPFEPRELAARIHTVLRRHARATAVTAAIALPPYVGPCRRARVTAVTEGITLPLYVGPYRLDCKLRCLHRENCRIDLTGSEFALLKVLAQHAGTPLSRERLASLIDGRYHDYDNRALDVQVSRLRRLLGDDPARPCYLQTVRGKGYMLVLNEDAL
jgi:two-component system phosphate regulon response regulator OmpR